MTALKKLHHAFDVATYRADQDGPDGYPLVGAVERGEFLLKEVARLLSATGSSGLIAAVREAREAALGNSNDDEIAALQRALDVALDVLELPTMHHDLYDPKG